MQNSRSMGRCIHHTPSKAVLGGELVVLTGGIVASQDLQSNGGAVSLNRHVHTGEQAGSDTTASPVGG